MFKEVATNDRMLLLRVRRWLRWVTKPLVIPEATVGEIADFFMEYNRVREAGNRPEVLTYRQLLLVKVYSYLKSEPRNNWLKFRDVNSTEVIEEVIGQIVSIIDDVQDGTKKKILKKETS